MIKETGKKANRWEITRLGADIKIKCSNCDHVVMMSRHDFEQKMKKVIKGSVTYVTEPFDYFNSSNFPFLTLFETTLFHHIKS